MKTYRNWRNHNILSIKVGIFHWQLSIIYPTIILCLQNKIYVLSILIILGMIKISHPTQLMAEGGGSWGPDAFNFIPSLFNYVCIKVICFVFFSPDKQMLFHWIRNVGIFFLLEENILNFVSQNKQQQKIIYLLYVTILFLILYCIC